MCACVIRTALSECGSNGGSCQFRSRSSFNPWNRPQSTSTRALFVWTRYFDPVTVPTPPQNSILDNLEPSFDCRLPIADCQFFKAGISQIGNWQCLGCQLDHFLRGVFHSSSNGEVKT